MGVEWWLGVAGVIIIGLIGAVWALISRRLDKLEAGMTEVQASVNKSAGNTGGIKEAQEDIKKLNEHVSDLRESVAGFAGTFVTRDECRWKHTNDK